ncbi:MAG: phage tail tape measure protein, partial [Xanthomonadaceae bacterium]|nr:phage tail tape measure protein [Xanthomonadaceae bacterium]
MVDDVVVSVKTEVEKAEELVKLKDNLARFGEASEEVEQGVDDLVESINAIAEAKEIADDIAKTTEAFNAQSEALEKAKEEYKRADEALLEFGNSLSDIEKKEAEAVVKAHEKEVERLTKAYEKAEKAMTKANGRYEVASGYVKQLSSDSAFYERELNKTIKKQTELNGALEGMKDLSLARKDFGLVDARKEIDKLNESYRVLKESGELTTGELKIAHQKLTEEVKKYEKQLKGTEVALGKIKKGIPAFVATAGFFGKMAHDAMGFESAMSDVAKVMGGTDEEVARLSRSILEMSKRIPIAAEGLAKIAESGAQIGLQADDLEQYTEQVAKMATAFGMTTEDAGKSVADMMNVFQIGLDGVSDLSDAINEL